MERRDFLQLGAGGFFGALLSRYALADTPAVAVAPKAKAIVLLWMNGGPSHLETWDPKPGHLNGGPTKAIRTSLPGLSISEHMPRVAQVASKLGGATSRTVSLLHCVQHFEFAMTDLRRALATST